MTIEIATVGVTTEIVIETATAIEDADRQMIDDVGLETKIDIKNEEDDLDHDRMGKVEEAANRENGAEKIAVARMAVPVEKTARGDTEK